jgi:enediyne biosynthesis protein E5
MSPEQARIGALVRFSIAITILNLLGHTILGFEISVVQMLVCLATGYVLEIILETMVAWSENRKPLFAGGGVKQFVVFLLPAHITSLATSMLLYPGDRLLPLIFGVTIAMTSKAIFTVTVGGKRRHFLNPSNTGIAATLFLFPTVGALPYHFTAGLSGYWDWALPALILCTGTFLNSRFNKRMPLIVDWLCSFVVQAVIRHFLYPTWLLASLAPMTSVAFLLFTFYMITDPQTSPSSVRGQIVFGVSIGAVYGALMGFHVVYMIFPALFLVCLARGIILYICEFDSLRMAQALAKRQLLTVFGRPSLTNVPATPGNVIERSTRP